MGPNLASIGRREDDRGGRSVNFLQANHAAQMLLLSETVAQKEIQARPWITFLLKQRRAESGNMDTGSPFCLSPPLIGVFLLHAGLICGFVF